MTREAAPGHAVPASDAAGTAASGDANVVTVEAVAADPPHHHLGRRNDRLLLLAVAAYAILLSFLMIARGIAVTPDVVAVGFGLAALLLGRGKLFLRDWIPFVALFFAYELMRGYANKFGLPIHVTDIMSLERIVGLGGLPTHFLQGLFHSGPATSPDNLATISVIFYFLHFPLPLAIGFLLWLHQRRVYYDFVAALIVLSMAAFVTYLLLPVAPPWWADKYGFASGILHLQDNGFQGLIHLFGFARDNYFYSNDAYGISPNPVAAFPSLHAAYPFLAFLFAKRAFGRIGWLMMAYTVCVWFAIVYLGEHWVVDIIGGVMYAAVAYFVVMHGPRWARRFMEQIVDEEIEAGVEAEDEGDVGALRRLGRQVRWTLVAQGVVAAGVGIVLAYGMSRFGWMGGTTTGLYLLPWLAILGGLWRGAAGLLSR